MAKQQTPPKTFETAVDERGNFLIQHCREVLNAAEKQIEVISKGPDGTLTTRPFESAEEPSA
jgi:exonuclease VII small subunit